MRADRIGMAVGAGALALILGALGFQYIGHLAPCEMCHWQRWPHIAAAFVGLGGGILVSIGFIAPRHARALALCAIFLVIASGLIGAYQQGMQYHLLPGPEACTGHPYVLGSNIVPEVQCDFATWQLFGISLAGYNALISFGIALFGFICLRKKS